MCDLLNPQTDITFDLLHQSTFKPATLSWKHFNIPTSYNHTPLGPLGCKFIMHKKTNARPSWDFCGIDGWDVGVSFEHYPFHLIVAEDTNSVHLSDTVKFRHHYLTQPTLTYSDKILNGIKTLSCTLTDAPTVTCDTKLRVIIELRDLIQRWADPSQLITVPPQPHQKTHSGTPKLRKCGKQRKSRQTATQPPLRVHNPAAAAQSPRVRIPEATALTPRVETSDPTVETSDPRVNKPLLQSHPQ